MRAFEVLLVLVGAVALLGCLLGLSGDSRQRLRQSAPVPRAPAVNVAEAERDGAVRVSVVTGDKQGLAGATVRVLWERQRRYFDAGSGITNGDGIVSITRVPRRRVWLLAEAEGHARASTQLIIECGAREVTLELAPATCLAV